MRGGGDGGGGGGGQQKKACLEETVAFLTTIAGDEGELLRLRIARARSAVAWCAYGLDVVVSSHLFFLVLFHPI